MRQQGSRLKMVLQSNSLVDNDCMEKMKCSLMSS